MSQPAKKRPAPPSAATDEVRDQEGSGRFVIEAARPSETMLPPTSPAAEGAQLEALPLLELEPDALQEIPATRGIVSGVFANGATPSEERDDELENAVASMHAYYRDSERQQHERAQLVIEDFSLLPGNPYGASSLVPPTRKPLALGKVLGVAALAVALGTGAWFVQRETSGARGSAAHAAPKVAVAAAVVHAPVVTQPVVEAQPKVESAQFAPVAVAATPALEREAAPAADVRVPSVRKMLAATEAEEHESARPAVTAPARDSEHDATAQAALRAVLAGPAPESATASTTRETAAPSVAPIEAAPVAVAVAAADTMGALPDLPSREDVVTGFESVRDELSKCAAGKHGTVKIDTTIANSGRVSKALIDGVFMGTPEGSCMARAARAARFPQFGRPSLSVSYPIAL